MKRKWKVLVASLVGLVALNYAPVAYGSMFGEENATLVQILAQSLEATDELRDLNDGMNATADALGDVRDTYAKTRAGIDELKNYSFDSFLQDFKEDLYKTYPGFEKFKYASENLGSWEGTRTSSPWTAYEAITAVVGDLSDPLREDVEAGRANVDSEMLLLGESGQSFTSANVALEATRKFDQETEKMTVEANSNHIDSAAAELISARAMVMIAAQNSHIIRLLSRGVQVDGIDRALEYGRRIKARNAAYEDRLDAKPFVQEAVKPAPMLDWTELE